MPNIREKLIELLRNANRAFSLDRFNCDHFGFVADHLIAHGVTVQEWISVKDRLPDQGQQVIVYSGNILSPSVFAYQFWNKDYDSWAHITHWMPLPEAPKGE